MTNGCVSLRTSPRSLRSIGAIRSQHRFEPEINEVIVEGAEDRAILERFFEVIGMKVKVREVGLYQVDDAELVRLGLDRKSNHDRCVYVAHQVCEILMRRPSSLAVLLDADVHFERRSWGPKCLQTIQTDRADTAGYSITEMNFSRFVSRYMRLNVDAARLFSSMRDVAATLATMRAANYCLQLGCAWISQRRSMKIEASSVTIDFEVAVDKYLGALKNDVSQRAHFMRECAEIQSRYSVEKLYRGHDFFEVVMAYGAVFSPGIRLDESLLARYFASVMDDADYNALVFEELKNRLAS